MVRQDTLRNRARRRGQAVLCPESRRSFQIRESPLLSRFSHYWWPARETTCSFSAVFGLIFIIYLPRRDNVSLLRALKAISEFVVGRLLLQFINLFPVSPRLYFAILLFSFRFRSFFSFNDDGNENFFSSFCLA